MLGFIWLMLLADARLVISSTAHQGTNNGAYASPTRNIFILAGQSNMSGRGGVINETVWDGVVPPECRPSPSILRFSAALTWTEAQDPLHRDIDWNKTCGVGPGMPFANTVLEKDSSFGLIGLVPCAVGGTNISEWARGTFLYNQMVNRAKAALQGGGGGTIRALLWYQGESDTISHEDAKMYKKRLERFFTHARADLDLPMLPVIQVALASGPGPYVDMVRESQLGIDLPNVRCVDAKGLQLQGDRLHLTTAAQVELGEMMADAFLQTLPLPYQSSSASASKGFHNLVVDLISRVGGYWG